MNTTRLTPLASILTAFALALGCAVEDGELNDESSEEGAETLDDGGEDEGDEFRTYEGVIANPSFGTAIRTGTTVGKTDEFTPTCAPSLAPDVSYTWTAPFTGSFTFSTAGSSLDTVLHVRPFTNSAQTLACNNNVNGTLQSSVTVNLTVGTTVIIVVDGIKAKTGSFQLHIAADQDCVSGCKNPPTQCHAGPGVCLIDPLGDSWCHYFPQPIGTACDDGNACTGSGCYNYSCVPDYFTTCNNPPSECLQPSGTCNPVTGSCGYDPKPAGTACDDGLACTTGDACNGAGACLPQVDACDPGTVGSCDFYGPGLEDCGGGLCCVLGTGCSLCIN